MDKMQECIEDLTVIGTPAAFAVGYAFIGDERTTEIALFLNGSNLLGFTKNGCHYTTRWLHLESLVAWLEDFTCNMREDPFPIDVDGEFANERIAAALELAPADEESFWDYFFPIHEWTYNHSWHSESAGTILADVYFELKDGMVELSWDNRDPEDGVTFDCIFGGGRVEPAVFRSVVLEFVEAYERHWGMKL